MKKIILMKEGIETLEFFSLQLEKAFCSMGYEVFLFPLKHKKQGITDLKAFVQKGSAVLLTFNFLGISGEPCFSDTDHGLFWDAYQIPCFNIVVDHPLYYHDAYFCLPSQYCQISIDRFHEKYMRRFYPFVPLGPFLPLGGTALSPKFSSFRQRDNLLVFAGNYTPPDYFDCYIKRLGSEYEVFYRTIIEELKRHPHRTMETVFEESMIREMGPLTNQELRVGMKYLMFLDLYIRFYFRGKIVKTIADSGIPIHLYGKGWNKLPCAHPENLISYGLKSSKSCLEIFSQAKYSLNIMPWFKDGAHDRIFNSMLNGAVCISDSSIYLRENTEHKKHILFYDLENLSALPDQIREIFHQPEQMEYIQSQAYELASNEHTWKARAKTLSGILDCTFFSD